MLLRAISMAFCRLGSPTGSSLCRSDIAWSTSCGFPTYKTFFLKRETEKRRRRGRTGHLAYPFADTPTHADDADLPERILVEPLGDKLARVLEREVEPRRPHVPVRHGRREVQQEDEMADDRAAYRRGRGEKSCLFVCFFSRKDGGQ